MTIYTYIYIYIYIDTHIYIYIYIYIYIPDQYCFSSIVHSLVDTMASCQVKLPDCKENIVIHCSVIDKLWAVDNTNDMVSSVDVCSVIYQLPSKYLSHRGQVKHVGIRKIGHQWLVACSAPSRYLKQCCSKINITFANKIQLHFEWKYDFLSKEMHLKMSAQWEPFCLGLNLLKLYTKTGAVNG